MYDVKEIRKLFPMLNGKLMQGKPLVFLDNSSTSFKPQSVIDAMNRYYTEETSNAHRGDYDLCYNLDKQIEETRIEIAKFINSNPKEVVFTSGDTMAMNLVAYGYGFKFLKPNDEIVISRAEHASNVLPWFNIAKLTGAIIKYVELDEQGKVTLEYLKKVLSNNTKIVSLAHVSNVLGYTIDIKAFSKIVHEVGAVFVVDGAQSVPHMKVDFKDSDIDFLAFSAHKMCGPTGIGCLIGKYDLLEKMDPLFLGGGMNEVFKDNQEYHLYHAPEKFEAGTQNISAILGFKEAVKFLTNLGMENIEAHEKELGRYLRESLKDVDSVVIYNKDIESGILTFNVKGNFAQDEASLLNSKGIAIRSGQHCAKLLNDSLKTIATCRASVYLYTTKEEIDIFVNALKEGGDILDAFFS